MAPYVLIAILKKRLLLRGSLHEILQVLSLNLFEKTPILQACGESQSHQKLAVFSALSRNLTKCPIGVGFVISPYPGNSTVRRSGRQMPVLRRASLRLAGSRTSSEVV